jgi:hypothetical protein
VALALALCAALLPACGSDDSASGDPTAQASSYALPDLQDASCRDWRRADAGGRGLLLARLETSRAQPVTGRGVSGGGTVLDDRKARRMLDELCSRVYFQHLRLYRVYALASDFAGTPP